MPYPRDLLTIAWEQARTANPVLNVPREQILETFNTPTVQAQTVDVEVNDILHYFALNPGLLRSLQTYAAGAATTPTPGNEAAADLFAMLAFPGFGPFKTSDPATLASVSTMLNTIAADPASALTASQAQDLLNLASVSQNWAQANGYGDFITNAMLDARGLV